MFFDRIGIFARTFDRPSLAQTLDAVCVHPIRIVQFNLSCAGMPTLPDRLGEADCAWIAASFRERGLTMAAVSGTFNPLDADRDRLEANLRRFDILAASCRWLDTRIITLCTGTRDPEDMWRYHPGNAEPDAWDEMVGVMRRIVAIADRHEVTVAFEPEMSNVVDSARKAVRLLDEVASPFLKVVLDPANLLHGGNLARMGDVLGEAFELLSGHTVLLHAKDVLADGSGTTAAGHGVMDYARVASLNHQHGLTVPIVVHGLPEDLVPASLYHVADAFARSAVEEGP